MSAEKALRAGEERFVAKEYVVTGKGKAVRAWGVYDRAMGSWPRRRPGVGTIKQRHESREEAEAEAKRLADALKSS